MKKTTKKTIASVSPVTSTATKAPAKATPVAITTATAPATSVKAAVAPPAKPAGPAKSAPAKTSIVTAAAPITIEAKIDVGFGNNLFVRGQGAGLSWDQGTPLECVDSQTWRLTVPAKDKLQFKVLLNDSIWAKGEDVVATPGKKVEVVPAF